jgi:hypothetical protein
MPSTILVSDNPLSSAEVMRELAPPGFEIVLARPGSAEWSQTLAQAEYLVGLGEVKMDDAFYHGAPKLRRIPPAGLAALDDGFRTLARQRHYERAAL